MLAPGVIWRAFSAGTIALTAMLTTPVAADDMPVDLELVLAVDVSGSMDEGEQALQRQGYVRAFLHPEVVAAIAGGVYGRIAVTYVEWAGPRSQSILIPWRALDGSASAEAFAATLKAAPTSHIHGTSISGALAFASTLFDGNGFSGARQAIDVSGDGPNNTGPPVVPVRDAVVARGITINGLPLTLHAGWGSGYGGLEAGLLDLYYEDCVIGGPGAFFLSVKAPEQLADAIRRKLVLEIAGRPPALSPAQFSSRSSSRVDCMIGEKTRPSWLNENR